jgi:acyl-CoA thioesterase
MDLIKFFGRDQFAKHAGISLLEVSKGFARASMEVGPHHLNGVGIVQGGAIFTLADLAFAAACNSHGTVAVAVSASISFSKATTSGVLQAEAREVAVSPRLSTCEVRVTDETRDLVAPSLERRTARRRGSRTLRPSSGSRGGTQS